MNNSSEKLFREIAGLVRSLSMEERGKLATLILNAHDRKFVNEYAMHTVDRRFAQIDEVYETHDKVRDYLEQMPNKRGVSERRTLHQQWREQQRGKYADEEKCLIMTERLNAYCIKHDVPVDVSVNFDLFKLFLREAEDLEVRSQFRLIWSVLFGNSMNDIAKTIARYNTYLQRYLHILKEHGCVIEDNRRVDGYICMLLEIFKRPFAYPSILENQPAPERAIYSILESHLKMQHIFALLDHEADPLSLELFFDFVVNSKDGADRYFALPLMDAISEFAASEAMLLHFCDGKRSILKDGGQIFITRTHPMLVIGVTHIRGIYQVHGIIQSPTKDAYVYRDVSDRAIRLRTNTDWLVGSFMSVEEVIELSKKGQ